MKNICYLQIIISSVLLGACGASYAAKATDTSTIIPYKVINVNQDYMGQNITEIADMGAYMGGGTDKLTLKVVNNTGITIWLRQTSNSDDSKNALVALPIKQSISLPGSQWQTTAIKNIWMKVLNCGTQVPTSGAQADKECTQICNSAITAPDTWKANDGVNKVPYGGTINTFTLNGDGSAAKTLCPWQHTTPPPVPTPLIFDYGTTTTASDLLAQDIAFDTKNLLINLKQNVSQQDYDAIKAKVGTKGYPCQLYGAATTNQILCTYDIHLPGGNYNLPHDAKLQLLLNDGVRAVSAVEEANLHLQHQPDLNQIQIAPSDIKPDAGSSYMTIANLQDYFNDPSQTEKAHIAKKQKS